MSDLTLYQQGEIQSITTEALLVIESHPVARQHLDNLAESITYLAYCAVKDCNDTHLADIQKLIDVAKTGQSAELLKMNRQVQAEMQQLRSEMNQGFEALAQVLDALDQRQEKMYSTLEQGGYGAIAKAVGNKLVVDDDQIRSQLLKDLTQCAALSDQTGRPVLFTTMGHPPRMMLLPDLRRYETYKLPFDVLASVARQVGSSVADADTNIPLNQESTDQQAWDRWVLEADDDTINDLIERKRNGSKPEPMNPPSEPLNQRSSNTPSGSGNGSPSRFTPLELTLNQVLRLIRELRSELNQTEIIERLWQVKKGGSEAWKKAHAEFKQLTEGENQ
jgi:hypothetical protein